MTHRSPLVTLAGLVLAFGIMFGVNLASSAPRGSYGAASSPPVASATTTAPSPTDSASASATESSAASDTPSPSATPTSTPTKSEADGSKFPAKVVYAGRTRDGSAAIAVAVLGNRAAAYLCDGRSVEAWLRGTVDEDEIGLRSSRGSRLEAKLHGAQLRGRIKVSGGEELKFRLGKAGRPAGLYRAKGGGTTIGWIVLPDGSQVGVQTTGGRSTRAPELDPDRPQVEVDGGTLDASPVEGDEEV